MEKGSLKKKFIEKEIKRRTESEKSESED